MAKKVKTVVKLQLSAGQATPAPPVGTALGPHGVNIMEFCKQFNEATRGKEGSIIPAVLTIYEDRSFTFKLKTPPASDLLKKAAGLAKGSGQTGKEIIGSVTREQVAEIARLKMTDLNASDLEMAVRIIEGTARSLGLEIKE
ncbi:MAG TPA: 50S ribosomal protein L11 [bacterium]|uniref:Large ribosomal subunit protein uL11 n=1 Tax=candidate division TA06 bacterium ADurb.Bin417 TaxID=1852828 RepID=A0A1V5MKC2_UNCT6|nr:MAG: 50S ribosomal protein L11 [candidate division TA06 bacterium ADurb.Bin417]HNQ35840.1 50S ribosomal protein L11 [bacterium]HNS48936.1 50S ribosomal protein L11 [bacterium]